MKKDKILVIGGYGQVGQHVCIELMKIFPGRVFAGGRNIQKAISFSNKTDGRVRPFKIDIYDKGSFYETLSNITLVIMCLTPHENDFALYCINNKINYIDISPSNKIPSEIELFKDRAINIETVCVLGVGLSPGLSNLMVKKGKSYFDEIKTVDLFLLLGLGERHGIDGIKWVLDNINKEFSLKRFNTIEVIKTFKNKKKTKFPKKLKIRTAYSFDLADQHSIPITLGLNNVSSYFCYDSVFVTKELVFLKKIGLFKILKYKFFYNLFARIFNLILLIINKFRLSSDIYSIKVDIEGIKDNRYVKHQSSIIGYNNSLVTGKVATFVANQIYNGDLKNGIYYLEEVLDFDIFYEHLRNDIEYEYKIT